jgi:hypothetical protein
MAEHERNAKMTIFYPEQPPEAQTTTERRWLCLPTSTPKL